MDEEESESMEKYEKYLKDAKFMIKNKKNFYKDNNNNFQGLNNINNINLASSFKTAAFNSGINSKNNQLINFQSEEIQKDIGNLNSIKENILQKSSSLKIYDTNKIYNEEIKCLKEEISKLKFQIEISQKRHINYYKTIEKLKNLQRENNLKQKKLYLNYTNKENNLNEKLQRMEEKMENDEKDMDLEYGKKINILEIKLKNIKENNSNLKKKLFNIKKENNKLEQINNMNIKQNELNKILLFKEKEIQNLKENINNFRNNYSIIEEENKNKIKELMQLINKEKNALDNNILHKRILENNNIRDLNKLKKSSSTIYNNYKNNFGESEDESTSAKSLNLFDLYKVKKLEKNIQNLEIDISYSTIDNNCLARKISKLKSILEKYEINKQLNDNLTENIFIKEKFNYNTVKKFEEIKKEYEQNLKDTIKMYDLKINEQNKELYEINSNYEKKIQKLLKEIKKLNDEKFI